MSRKVLVLGETREGSLRNVSFEAIAAAKTVAEGGEVVGVLIGESVSGLGSGINSIRCRPCCSGGRCKVKTVYIRRLCSSLTCSA